MVSQALDTFRQAIPDPTSMNHNLYYRLVSLAYEIMRRERNAEFSVLDIGGGEGQLASFLPDNVSYCLVEPKVNGISGTNLPFPDCSFDYVVSCHVLEHIPVSDRKRFLDQLVSKSKRGVILLNPFYIEGTHIDERLKLCIEITGAEWAKEHLDCSLPRVQDVLDYAREKGLECDVKPNGTLTTSMAFVFIDYFASKAGFSDDRKKINTFFNDKFKTILDSQEYPNSYLIYLGKQEARVNGSDGEALAEI
jgi:SAM-dependent methyltransferase